VRKRRARRALREVPLVPGSAAPDPAPSPEHALIEQDLRAAEVLLLRARRAYEWGRARAALRYAPVAALAALAAICSGRPVVLSCIVGGALFALAAGLVGTAPMLLLAHARR
jgi:hypothetical protein